MVGGVVPLAIGAARQEQVLYAVVPFLADAGIGEPGAVSHQDHMVGKPVLIAGIVLGACLPERCHLVGGPGATGNPKGDVGNGLLFPRPASTRP